jgi:hypothetical protein
MRFEFKAHDHHLINGSPIANQFNFVTAQTVPICSTSDEPWLNDLSSNRIWDISLFSFAIVGNGKSTDHAGNCHREILPTDQAGGW